MTIRAAYRALGWIISELIPAQAIRVARDRDCIANRADRQDAQMWRAHVGADALNEVEAEQECLEPRAQCMWCGGVDEPGHVCGREYQRLNRDAVVMFNDARWCREHNGLFAHCKQLPHTNFAGAAASLADGESRAHLSGLQSHQSVREDKRPSADPHTDSAVPADAADPSLASPAGGTDPAAGGHPPDLPEPAAGSTSPWSKGRFDAADWLEQCLRNNGLKAGAGWVLALVDGVLERANPAASQPVETGLDMGGRWAAETFPQHRGAQK